MRSPPIPGPPLPTSHITPNQTPGREKAKSGTNGDWRERRLFNSPPPQPSHPPPNQTLGPGAEKKVRWELEDNAHPPKHTTQARPKEMPCSSIVLGGHLGRRPLYRAKDGNYKQSPSSRHPRDRGALLNPGPPQLAFPLTPNQTLGNEKETPGEGTIEEATTPIPGPPQYSNHSSNQTLGPEVRNTLGSDYEDSAHPPSTANRLV